MEEFLDWVNTDLFWRYATKTFRRWPGRIERAAVAWPSLPGSFSADKNSAIFEIIFDRANELYGILGRLCDDDCNSCHLIHYLRNIKFNLNS